jgi:ribosome biogenesis GTPase
VTRAPGDGSQALPPGAAAGRVIAAHRRHFVVALDDGTVETCMLRGRSAVLACGDRVEVARAPGGAVIQAVLPRSTLFYRSDAYKEKLLAANVDQVVGVVAPDLSLDEELVHRWSVAASALGCRFVVAANKADLPAFGELAARLEPLSALGHHVVPVSARNDVTPLLPWLAGRHSVLVGQSGMGKSTLLNAAIPDAALRTAAVSQALSTGRHTTTHSPLHRLPAPLGEGWIVDSPGLKAFGLAHVDPDAIVAAFTEFGPCAGRCRFRDCRHDVEPDCAFRAEVAAGRAAPFRLQLLRTLVAQSRSVAAARR